MTTKTQTATAILSSVMLASGAVAAVPMIAVADQAPAAVEAAAAGEGTAVVAAAAQGTFAWQQNGLSTISYIQSVFAKAAAACAAMPVYEISVADGIVSVTGPNGTFSATVAEIAEDEGVASMILGCACSSNVAGGGAVVNAQVEGVSLAALAGIAGAF